MATFYIQLQDKLLQISGELTAENISKALGYVPISPNVINELSQRVDNITFDSLKDNPFLLDGSGELNIVDESGNIIAKIDAEGIHSVDFIAGEHTLSNKADKSELPTKISDLENDEGYLVGEETSEELDDIETNTYIKYVPQTLTEEQEEQVRNNIGAASTEYVLALFNELKDMILSGSGGGTTMPDAILDNAILNHVKLV